MPGSEGRKKLIGRMASADNRTSVERRGLDNAVRTMMTARLGEWTGNKKAPLGGLTYRAWVLPPDSYAAGPMRPPTTTKRVSIFMR
jgi:hypothetical protein